MISHRPRSVRKHFDWADTLAFQLRAMHVPEGIREFRFHPERKWRFDLCWPDRKLFVECDGGEFVKGSLGRHGTAKDCEKWNAATTLGWVGYRFVGSQIRSGDAVGVLEAVLSQVGHGRATE